MQCGAKRFIVTFSDEGTIRKKSVIARTPALARRVIRSTCGEHVTISTVKNEDRNK
ncbi:MAG TPA: hypothetical protein VK125_08025 [Bacillota bacterium]|nr:hypothetical protein [Bacillota bacterium]